MLMPKRLIATLAAGAALAATGCAPGGTAAPSSPAAMRPGQRMMAGELGQRTVRMVQINDNGGTVDLIYDMAPGQPQSQRVLRLENVNGMLMVIYDNTVPSMSLGSGGTPRLVQQGGGMYEVQYGPPPPPPRRR